MSNFYICGQCVNCNSISYHGGPLDGPLVNCKAQPFPVTPIAAIDFGRRYVYMDESGIEYKKPTDACEHFKPKEGK